MDYSNTKMPPHVQEEESGLSQRVRYLLSSISAHLLALLKLGQLEAGEAQSRISKKLFFLSVSAVFFFVFYICANGAGAFYLQSLGFEWKFIFLMLAGANLILGLVFIGLASACTLSPMFKETLTELENDLIWLKERRNAKRTSSEN